MTSSAPSARAGAILPSLPTVVMTRAPNSRAIWMAATPTPEPPPCTSTVWPGVTCALRTTICQAVMNGRIDDAASAQPRLAGYGATLIRGTTTYSP